MTVKELWLTTVFVGKVQFEDESHYLSSPLMVFPEGLDSAIFDENHHFNELANKEIKYFDFYKNTLRIILKKE